MTHHHEDTPTNGADPDGTPTLHRVNPALGPIPTFKPVRLGDPADDLDHCLLFVEPPGGDQEHEELVSRLIREGEALRTELGLPGFPAADAPPSIHLTGTTEQPTADHADGTVSEAPAVQAKDPGARQHRALRRRTARRVRGRERRGSAPGWDTVMTQICAENDLQRGRPGLTMRLLARILGVVVRDTVSEGDRRMVPGYTGRLFSVLLTLLISFIVVAGDVVLGMPSWLCHGTALLYFAVVLWRRPRQDLHEPDLSQQAAPHKDNQRT
ncbi:hypothetical protein [Streptomyces chartreusis]|uniref:hypothetical protein n=1 Tax=Streptomyces chartreusis TaxID=1969 RepID=UPI0035DA273D